MIWQPELILAAFLVLIVSSLTPGPNNTICCFLGSERQWKGSLPFVCGVMVGFPLLLVISALVVGSAAEWIPQAQWVIKILGALFIGYFAWKIMRAAMIMQENKPAVTLPHGYKLFWQALIFQWINPKAVIMAFSLTASYTRPGDFFVTDVGMLMLMAALMSFTATSVWSLLGGLIRHRLQSITAQRIFNGVMGGLLLLAIPPIFVSF